MKFLGFLIALFFVSVGAAVAVAPAGVLSAARYLLTPSGLYVVGALRVAIGLGLFVAASESRTPRTLRILGLLIVVGGIFTPFIGSERANAILDWYLAEGANVMRVWAGAVVLLGAFIAYSLGTGRRAG